MAYTTAIYSELGIRYVNLSIRELQSDFNQQYYKRVIWSVEPIVQQGQSTPPNGILMSVDATATGTGKEVNRQIYTNTAPYSPTDGMIYGTTQAANGLYYSAGKDYLSEIGEVLSFRSEYDTIFPSKLSVFFEVDGFNKAVKSSNYTRIDLTNEEGESVCTCHLSSDPVNSDNPNAAYPDGISNLGCIPATEAGKEYRFVKYYMQNGQEVSQSWSYVIIPAPGQ